MPAGDSTVIQEEGVSVVFSQSVYEVLEDLARQDGRSVPEVLRDAIGLEKLVSEVQREGGRVLIDRRGKVNELLR